MHLCFHRLVPVGLGLRFLQRFLGCSGGALHFNAETRLSCSPRCYRTPSQLFCQLPTVSDKQAASLMSPLWCLVSFRSVYCPYICDCSESTVIFGVDMWCYMLFACRQIHCRGVSVEVEFGLAMLLPRRCLFTIFCPLPGSLMCLVCCVCCHCCPRTMMPILSTPTQLCILLSQLSALRLCLMPFPTSSSAMSSLLSSSW